MFSSYMIRGDLVRERCGTLLACGGPVSRPSLDAYQAAVFFVIDR